jgi:hypothetical protein
MEERQHQEMLCHGARWKILRRFLLSAERYARAVAVDATETTLRRAAAQNSRDDEQEHDRSKTTLDNALMAGETPNLSCPKMKRGSVVAPGPRP